MSGPKILTLDIENAPMQAHVWSLFKVNVGLSQLQTDWYILSWAAKWMHEDYVYSDALINYPTDYKEDHECDYRVLVSIRDFIDEADIIVGHNSQAFDLPKIYARMLVHGITPPSPVQQIDTLKIAKQVFRFSSNKLQHIAGVLGLGTKTETGGHQLWTDCMRGDKDAWKLMVEYNEHDVVLTEQVYLALRPWTKTHPNHALYQNDGVRRCNKCGSDDVIRNGYAYTNLGKFQEYHCKGCGCYPRGRKNLADLSEVLTNVL